jgi:hypothetical protein
VNLNSANNLFLSILSLSFFWLKKNFFNYKFGNLLKEIDDAISAINKMLDEAVTVNVDDQINLRKFIQKWIK